MEITIIDVKLYSNEELKNYFLELSQFMKIPLSTYWQEKTDKINTNIKFPLIKLKDPLFKTWNLKPSVDDFIIISEQILQYNEIREQKRIRQVIK